MSSLLVRGLGGGWLERATPMIAARRRVSPRSASRRQVWAHRRRRLWRRRLRDVVRTFAGVRHAVGSAPGPLIRAVGSIEGDGHRAEGYRPVVTGALRDGRAASRPPETQKSWRRPIFPKGCPLSIFGAGELDFRVRDGNGYGLSASVTRIRCVWMLFGCDRHPFQGDRVGAVRFIDVRFLSHQGSITIPATDPRSVAEEVKPSTISTAQLHPSPDFHMRPIKQVVSLRSYPVDPVGNLISRRASHLDAFSAYPDRT